MTEQPSFAVVVPEEVEAGVYANAVSVWHTPTDFTMDFLVHVTGAAPVALPDGSETLAPRMRAVARVKLPPAQIFELMKALERQLSMFEEEQRAAGPA